MHVFNDDDDYEKEDNGAAADGGERKLRDILKHFLSTTC